MTAEEALEGADATASASVSDNAIDELRDQVESVARGYHLVPPPRPTSPSTGCALRSSDSGTELRFPYSSNCS
ncbi:hypothetical protein ABZ646_39020 [Streptomyces sp. NPDC007162]|uniref:hypothetical protein n=1 Tax=Streptomyces sp. NPDC007162 TaxID=3156917 RepID=UPI0033D9DB7F